MGSFSSTALVLGLYFLIFGLEMWVIWLISVFIAGLYYRRLAIELATLGSFNLLRGDSTEAENELRIDLFSFVVRLWGFFLWLMFCLRSLAEMCFSFGNRVALVLA